MATRRERVVLDVESNASAVFTRDALAAALLAGALDKLDGSSTRVSRSTSSLGGSSSGLVAFQRQAERSGASIDKLSDRARILADVLAMVGPGIVPIGAVAVPAIAGLANQLAFAAGAAGTAVVAFQGVGDALTAMQKASLEPTAANLAEARRQLEDLSPAAAEFVLNARDLTGALKEARDAAATGLFTPVNESFDEMSAVLERVEPILGRVGNALGEVFANGVESLAGGEWEDFFTFLENEAKPTLTTLGDTVGNFASGMAELWMTFAPLNADFGNWMKDVSEGFKGWAAGLESSQGLADFMDYLRTTGPQVAETFGAVANGVIQIVEAAAPLGGPVLQALEAVADAIAAIADSDLGTPLFAGLAAMAALNTATNLWGKASQTSVGQFVTGQAKAATGVRTLAADIKSMRGEYGKVNALHATMLSGFSNTTQAAQRTRASIAAVGKTAGTVAGIAAVTSGFADSLGVANTASLALMGSMVGGGVGAAAGGAIGAVMDFKAVAGDADAITRGFATALEDSGGSFSGFQERVAAGDKALNDMMERASAFGGMNLTAVGMGLDALFGGIDSSAIGKAAAEADMAREKVGDLELAARTMAVSFGIAGSASEATFGQMDAALASAAPAMQDLGLSVDDLINGVRDGSFMGMIDQIRQWQANADSAAGRTDALSEAIGSLDNDILSTASSAGALQAALDALLNPQLNLSAATDQWRAGLRNLSEELSSTNRSLVGNTDAADQNRAAVRQQVTNLIDLMGAQAEAGAGTGRLTRTMERGRSAIIEAGVAAGISRKQMREYVNTLGLTPEMVRTIVEANTSDAEQNVKRLKRNLDEYGLTRANARAALDDVASGKIKTVQGLIDKYGLTKKQAKALLDDQASGKLDRIISLLNQADRDVTSTIRIDTIRTTINRTTGASMVEPHASIPNARGGLYRSIGDIPNGHQPQIAAGGAIPRVWAEKETKGEAYIPLANDSRRPRAKSIAAETVRLLGGRAEFFASGGFGWQGSTPQYGWDQYAWANSGGMPSGLTGGRSLDDRLEIAQMMQQIRDLRQSLAADGKNKLTGLDRRIAALQMEAAERELRLLKKREQREDRQEAREKAREKRDALTAVGSGLSFDSIAPAPALTAAQGAAAEIAEFKADLLAAGGVWTDSMRRWADDLVATAAELDAVNASIVAEQKKRDELVDTLNDQQQALDRLTSTMESYSTSVANNFLTNPFSNQRTAANPGLAEAERQLAEIRASATGDSVESAARASQLIAQIAKMREQSSQTQQTLTGVEALRQTLVADTLAAKDMAAALAALAAKGLDTTGALGGLYMQLAASGDLVTAEQLAALSEAQIDEYEKMFAAREDAAALVAAQATQAVYGQQQAQMQALVTATNQAIARQDETLALLNIELATLGAEVRSGAASGVATLQPQLTAIQSAISDQARQNAEQKKKQAV